MKERKKIIYDFLTEKDRHYLKNDLQILKELNKVDYYEITYKLEILNLLTKLATFRDPLIIQIIAHGNCDGFGLDGNNYILYSEISPMLRKINKSTNNKLIINLMTICCSVYQLGFFNQGKERLFELLIGCTKGAFLKESILRSRDINMTLFQNLKNEITKINYDLDDNYCADIKETITFMTVE
jgi:hypothetical protein